VLLVQLTDEQTARKELLELIAMLDGCPSTAQ
jgi:hypothetical protein